MSPLRGSIHPPLSTKRGQALRPTARSAFALPRRPPASWLYPRQLFFRRPLTGREALQLAQQEGALLGRVHALPLAGLLRLGGVAAFGLGLPLRFLLLAELGVHLLPSG